MKIPLVSIIVVTYNSEDFVIETLESIKEQSYHNIELVISDDESKDRTVEICNDWLNKNSHRFVHFKIIAGKKNIGIPANCNRGIISSEGEWVKLIAGDDILLPNAIEKYIKFVSQYPEAEIIHAKVIRMVHKGDIIEYINAEKSPKTLHHGMTPEIQFDFLKFSSMVKAPSVLIKKKLLKNLNYFDESIKLCEDWPFWLKATSNGKKFYFLNEETVFYRIHDKSVYSGAENKFVISPFFSTEKIIYRKYIDPKINFFEKAIFKYHYRLLEYFFQFNNIKKAKRVKIAYSILNLPYRVYQKIIFLNNNK